MMLQMRKGVDTEPGSGEKASRDQQPGGLARDYFTHCTWLVHAGCPSPPAAMVRSHTTCSSRYLCMSLTLRIWYMRTASTSEPSSSQE